jgi:hypothetical protein
VHGPVRKVCSKECGKSEKDQQETVKPGCRLRARDAKRFECRRWRRGLRFFVVVHHGLKRGTKLVVEPSHHFTCHWWYPRLSPQGPTKTGAATKQLELKLNHRIRMDMILRDTECFNKKSTRQWIRGTWEGILENRQIHESPLEDIPGFLVGKRFFANGIPHSIHGKCIK